LFFGSRRYSNVNFTDSAVNRSPEWNRTSRRSVNSHVRSSITL